MASSLEDDLSCPVCCEVYQDPQLLPCGHSFCGQCLDKHFTFSSARTCPVCRQRAPQKVVANLVLRNACESYLKEKESESDGEAKCSQHGEKMSFFCRTDKEPICPQCRKQKHGSHRVQPISHAIRQHKSRVKEALLPAKKALKALHDGTSTNAQIANYIESQAREAERLIKKEFERFRQFLCDEEEARIAALKNEVDRKRGKVQEKLDREMLSLSEKVKEVEDEMEKDGASFLQNFDFMLKRAEYRDLGSEFGAETFVNMPEHVGNLGYRVWQKMTDIFRYYPVVLDPNTAPADFSISKDLVCVGKSSHNRPIPVPHQGNRIVLGSEGYSDGVHCWDIEVGNSRHWTIGVCQRSTELYRSIKPMSPETGFWGLSCKGDSYSILASRLTPFRIRKKVRIVRVSLGWWYTLDTNIWRGWRVLSFLNVADESLIAFTGVPPGVTLFPFLVPEEQFSPLRIAPADVVHTLEHRCQLEERKGKDIVCIILFLILGFLFGTFLKNE